MAYQSLYRRYRPQKFSEVRGQEHVVKALRNAVRDDRVGHAYLLSGPRGTGKTTAARILAKVLNCATPIDGEPCGECDSCRSIEAGTSFDLHELDAASNNKVDDVRDLLSKVALGTPGRTKVYLLDEVHMLTPGAENALLKTLEEPPDHVVFVLATTEPHKVVSTIRSRTQQLELTLIGADEMADLVREIAVDADLDIDDEIIGHVIKAGGGSARDTLSSLDQAVAAGGVTDADTSTPDLLTAMSTGDVGLALKAIEAATDRGVDPRRIGERLIDALRNVFLVRMGSAPARLSEPERQLADQYAEGLNPATITRALETVGHALVDMRQAPDPRIDLEVALVRVVKPAMSGDTAALETRIAALESIIVGAESALPTEPASPSNTDTGIDSPATPSAQVATPAPSKGAVGKARAALKPRAEIPPPPSRGTPAAPPPTEAPAPEPDHSSAVDAEDAGAGGASDASPTPASPVQPRSSGAVELDVLRSTFVAVLEELPTAARNRFRIGTVDSIDDENNVLMLLPNEAQRQRCEKFLTDVQDALSRNLGESIAIELSVGAGSPSTRTSSAPETSAADDEVDLHELTDADSTSDTVVERIAGVFPGAEILTTPES